MIISKIPLRITLGGGGTDLKSYYSRYGGLVLSAAICLCFNESFVIRKTY